MSQVTNPFALTLLGIVVGSLLTMVLNFAVNRVTRRQDRLAEWYDRVDQDRATLQRQIELMAYQLHEMHTLVEDMRQLAQRTSILEMKLGMWWRSVETHVAERLQPPPRYDGP